MKNIQETYELDVVSVRLVKDAPICSGIPISSPFQAVTLVAKELCEMDREVMCVINLKTNGIPINCSFVSMGCLDYALAHPREILKAGFLSNAASMIMVHNHPSGNLSPSKDDVRLTDRMMQVGTLAGIELLDHIIVGGDNSQYFSFREQRIMPVHSVQYETDYTKLEFPTSIAAEKGRGR